MFTLCDGSLTCHFDIEALSALMAWAVWIDLGYQRPKTCKMIGNAWLVFPLN
jgi:hypothetical protein